jgi:hypothetical protein
MENCIMVALAGRGMLTGTLDDIADGLEIPTDDLRATLRQLVGEQQIAVQTQPGGYLTVRVERRSPGGFRDGGDRRRHHVEAWRL